MDGSASPSRVAWRVATILSAAPADAVAEGSFALVEYQVNAQLCAIRLDAGRQKRLAN